MADSGSVSFERGLELLHLTPDEKRAYATLFRQADTDNTGVITGDVAVKFLERTNVPGDILGIIWQIADSENRGFLTPSEFAICLRLIAHFQAGKSPEATLAFQPAQLPKFDGALIVGPASPLYGPPSGALQPQLSGAAPIRVPPLAPEKAAMYAKLFEDARTRNGLMPGETAKNIFEKARLPNETLGRIWNLADTEQRGALGQTEFIIAMHLLASVRTGTMAGVPATLPAGLYEAAARRGTPVRLQGPPPVTTGPMPRQFSGSNQPRTSSPLTRAPYGSSPQQTQNDWDWDISPHEKSQYDAQFVKIDSQRTGFVLGNQAVVFFSDSGLSEDELAQVWDLADIRAEGRLNRDGFAVAMHLIRMQRGKQQNILPRTLPPRLIPPSMRNTRQIQQSTAPAFDNAQFSSSMSKSAAEDLFGLDALVASPPGSHPPQVPQSTGGSAGLSRPGIDPFGSQPGSPQSPQQSAFRPQSSTSGFTPFKPTSAFALALQKQNTGGSVGSTGALAQRGMPQGSAYNDLLGDNDPEVNKKLTPETMELANMSNQIGTLRTQMVETQKNKTMTESELNKTSTQKRDLELRLSQFRSQYEQEVKNLKALQDRLNTSREETERLRREYTMLEGSYQDLSLQNRQVSEALAADQRENALLKQKIAEINAEVSQLKPQLEKMRSDARQQKGMVAINKKQLSTNEAERDKIKGEMDEQSKAAEGIARTSTVPEPASAATPALSTVSQSSNPFFRRGTQPSLDNAMSPGDYSRPVQPSSSAQDASDNFFNTPAPKSPLNFGPRGSSLTSSDDPMFPTPSASPPLSSYHESPQPPPPSDGRQMTSKDLPFRDPLTRSESIGSSARLDTLANRIGGPGADTPTAPAANAPLPGDASRGLERTDSAKTETSNFFGLSSTTTPAVSVPGMFPDPTPAAARNNKSDFDAAFANYGASKAPENRDAASSHNGSVASSSKGPSEFSQRFPPIGGEVSSSAASKPKSEFPPIQDVGGGEYSDSSDDDVKGFDDNFGSPGPKKQAEAKVPDHNSNPNSLAPKAAAAAAAAGALPAGRSTASNDDPFALRPKLLHVGESTRSNVSDLASPNVQASSPTYGETMAKETSADEGPNDHFLREHTGLLPTGEGPTAAHVHSPLSASAEQKGRAQSPENIFGGPVGGGGGQGHALFGENISSPLPQQPQQPQHQLPRQAIAIMTNSSPPTSAAADSQSTSASDAFHSAASHASAPSAESLAAANLAKFSTSDEDEDDFGKDFDAEFENLPEAPVVLGDEEGLFAHLRRRRADGTYPDFLAFDSPRASKTNSVPSAGPTPKSNKGIQSISGPAFQAMSISGAPDTSEFARQFDAAFARAGNGSYKTKAKASQADWDDIFGMMDKEAESSKDGAAAAATFSFDDDFVPFSPAAAAAGAPSSAAATTYPAPPGSSSPLPRAPSTGTEHDDPILKDLTGKGFPRAAALEALERFDYDSSRALEHLSEPLVQRLVALGFSREESLRGLRAYEFDVGKAADYLASSK